MTRHLRNGGYGMLCAVIVLLASAALLAAADPGTYPVIRLAGAPAQTDLARLPRFFSSDPAYDAFTNDYFMRHLSVDERGVYLGGGPVVGSTDHMWVIEWDNWLFPWIDRAAMGLARQGGSDVDVIMNTLRTAAIDKFGYTLGARPEPEPVDSLGGYKPSYCWPWPKYNRNTTAKRPTGWEFNDPNDGARSEWSARDVLLRPGYQGHCLEGVITGSAPEAVSPRFDVDVFHVPVIELDIAYRAASGADRMVRGLRLYWSTDAAPGFSERRMVSVDFATLPPQGNEADFAPWVSPTTSSSATHTS